MAEIALVPAVSLNGSPLSASWQAALIEIRCEAQFQVPARCTLRFSDPGYALVQDGTATIGATLKVTDPGDSSQVLADGEVTSVAVEHRPGEQPELVIVGHDKSHRLGRITEVKTYVEMTYSDIVQSLAGSAGLGADADTLSSSWQYVLQADSALGLLTEIAHRTGYDWWVADGVLKFKKPAAGTSVSLALGTDLLAFSARASGIAPSSVTVLGWDRDQQQAITGSASSATSAVQPTSTLASLATSSSLPTSTLKSGNIGIISDNEATDVSQAILDVATAAAVSAQGVAVGNGKLKLGATASVSGAGPLSGDYPITRVEHLFRPRSGYVTRFYSGDRRPTTLVDTLSGVQGPNSVGSMHSGVVVGTVTNINDPNNSGRVKVMYPNTGTQLETDWARIVGIGGGANRGAVFVPEVNDEVLVAFEGGDPRQPVVIGGLFGSKSTIPTPSIDDGAVQQRGFMSRLGHTMYLLDGTDQAKQAIELTLAGGQHSLHLGKDKVTVTVPDGLAIEISAGNSSLKFGTDGSITISAPQVTINADEKVAVSGGQVQLSANEQLSLQSTGTANLQGAQVQISSDGPLSASGTPVSIN